MIKRLVYIFLLFVLLIVLGVGVYNIYTQSRYNLLVSSKNSLTQYPGSGYVSEKFYESILVEPKRGRPFYDSPNNISLYSDKFFNVTIIPEHEEMKYAVGNYHNLISTNDGSDDMFLLIKYPSDRGIYKYRISTNKTNNLFNNEKTTISYETYYLDNNQLKIDYNKNNIVNTTIDYKQLFKNKQLILIPLFDQGLGTNKKDSGGNHLITRVIIRNWK